MQRSRICLANLTPKPLEMLGSNANTGSRSNAGKGVRVLVLRENIIKNRAGSQHF